MDEYIKREAAYREICTDDTLNGYEKAYCCEIIKAIPAADVAPVRHGHWKQARYTEAPLYICSECDKPEYKQHNYCPHCGAQMCLKE